MKANVGRAIFMALVTSSFVLSIIIIFYEARSGGIHSQGVKFAIQQTLEIYLPILAIMGAFYFSGQEEDVEGNIKSPLQSFLFSFIVVATWVSFNPMLLLFSDWSIESIYSFLNDDSIGILGKTVAAGSITYYFSRFD